MLEALQASVVAGWVFVVLALCAIGIIAPTARRALDVPRRAEPPDGRDDLGRPPGPRHLDRRDHRIRDRVRHLPRRPREPSDRRGDSLWIRASNVSAVPRASPDGAARRSTDRPSDGISDGPGARGMPGVWPADDVGPAIRTLVLSDLRPIPMNGSPGCNLRSKPATRTLRTR